MLKQVLNSYQLWHIQLNSVAELLEPKLFETWSRNRSYLFNRY